jgi:hypothetical protein
LSDVRTVFWFCFVEPETLEADVDAILAAMR